MATCIFISLSGSILVVYAQVATPAAIDAVIAEDFFGRPTGYQAVYNVYLDQVKQSDTPSEGISFVSQLFSLPPSMIVPIIEFKY